MFTFTKAAVIFITIVFCAIFNLFLVEYFSVRNPHAYAINAIICFVAAYQIFVLFRKPKSEPDDDTFYPKDREQFAIEKHIDEVWTVDTKIENMGLSARLENGLAKLELYTIDQILKQGYKTLVDMPYLGEVTVNELNAKLYEKGIKLNKYPSAA